MFRAIATILVLLVFQEPPPFPPTPPMREAARNWVAYSAETKFTQPGAPDQFGRYVQDEHGCKRHEMVEQDGRAQITITNEEIGRSYVLLGGTWSSSPIRSIPGFERRPPQSMGRVVRKVDPIDDVEVYETEMPMRSARGDSVMSLWVVPALNFLVARRPYPNGRVETVTSIRTGPQRPEEFLPPPGAAVKERDEFRGGTFLAVVVQVAFAGQPPIEITTSETRPSPLRMPNGETLNLTTFVPDPAKDVVRVTLSRMPAPGAIPPKGEELSVVEVALGKKAEMVNGVENFTVSIRRIGTRFAR